MPGASRSGAGSQRPSREAKNSSAKSGTRGGGVAKRRSGAPVRLDRDGDLDMDAPAKRAGDSSAGASSRSRRSAGGPRKSNADAQTIVRKVITNGGAGGDIASRFENGMARTRNQRSLDPANQASLKVVGLLQSKAASQRDGGLRDLIDFLERKAQTVAKSSKSIRINKSERKGDSVIVTTTKQNAAEILKLDTFTFAGTPLSITEVEGEATKLSEQATALKTHLTNILSSRYNADTKHLDLSSLGQDPRILEMDMFSGETSPEKLFKALMAICKGIFKTRKEQREGLHTVSLAGNTLSDIDAVSSLADFPDILGLDLSNNMIADVKALAKWRNRFPKLESLNLDGNPILEKLEAAVPTFLEKWPRLLRLNHIQIRNPEETAARQAANRPRPIPQLGSNFRDVNGIGEGFVRELIQMYDSDRRSLAAKYYDDQSTFSLSVDNRGHRSASFQPPPWGPYQKVSRNHTKITHPPARRTRAFVGTTQIQSAWAQLPATRHPDLVTNLAKYVVECHPTNGLPDPSGQNPAGVEGMHITIRGEFDDLDPETNKTWTRSFCRTLLLGPGDPARNPIRVISDLLSLKAHSPFKQVTSSAIDLTDEAVKRFHVILELSKETGLNSEYATMCVDAAGGDPSKIIALFQEQKDSLPAEAFAAVAYTKWPTS